MIKKIIGICIIFLSIAMFSAGKKHSKGYQIKVTIKGLGDSTITLAHYYGKPTMIYKDQQIKLDKNGSGTFKVDSNIYGGLYLILFPPNQNYIELILNNGDNLEVTTTLIGFKDNLLVKGSDENKYFYDYQKFLTTFEKGINIEKGKLAACKTKVDSTKQTEILNTKVKELNTYRDNFIKTKSNSFLAHLFRAIKTPEVYQEKVYYPDGTLDSTYTFRKYKSEYWNAFPFEDERIAYTPFFHDKIDEYYSKLVAPIPDSVSSEAEWLLNKVRGKKELYHYTLWYITHFVMSSKIMGMDNVLVDLLHSDYTDRKNIYWLNDSDYTELTKKATLISLNEVGAPASDLYLRDTLDNKTTLSQFRNKYLLLCFWAPDCGHCRQELPKLDSMYKSTLSKYDIKVICIKTEGDTTVLRKFLEEKNISKDWLHLHDPHRESNYRTLYDVYSTPVLYLLNKERIIIGKRMNIEDIEKLLLFDQEGKIKYKK